MNIFDAIIARGAQERLDIAKAMDSEIEKAEGSRGGKVIGHTKSGKPIYDMHGHPEHRSFSSEDHLDALKAHNHAATTADTGSIAYELHAKQADKHGASYRAKKKEEGK